MHVLLGTHCMRRVVDGFEFFTTRQSKIHVPKLAFNIQKALGKDFDLIHVSSFLAM